MTLIPDCWLPTCCCALDNLRLECDKFHQKNLHLWQSDAFKITRICKLCQDTIVSTLYLNFACNFGIKTPKTHLKMWNLDSLTTYRNAAHDEPLISVLHKSKVVFVWSHLPTIKLPTFGFFTPSKKQSLVGLFFF